MLEKRKRWESTRSIANNYLEVLVDDENTMLEKLNRLCGAKHDVSIGARIPRKKLHMEVAEGEAVEECDVEHIDLGKSSMVRSKILTHIIKDFFVSYGNHFSHTRRVGIFGKSDQISKEKSGWGIEVY